MDKALDGQSFWMNKYTDWCCFREDLNKLILKLKFIPGQSKISTLCMCCTPKCFCLYKFAIKLSSLVHPFFSDCFCFLNIFYRAALVWIADCFRRAEPANNDLSIQQNLVKIFLPLMWCANWCTSTSQVTRPNFIVVVGLNFFDPDQSLSKFRGNCIVGSRINFL